MRTNQAAVQPAAGEVGEAELLGALVQQCVVPPGDAVVRQRAHALGVKEQDGVPGGLAKVVVLGVDGPQQQQRADAAGIRQAEQDPAT